jgi:protoporphyrinogen oxidase
MYAARRTGLKKEMFGYVRGGYERINSAFKKKLKDVGVTVILNAKVKELCRDIEGNFEILTNQSIQYKFDYIISTLPSDLSVQIVPFLNVEEASRHKAIKYLGVICPSILLRKPLSKFYVTNIIDGWTPFTGIIEMTALVDPQELGNRSLVYLPKYVGTDNELFDKTEQELREYFLGALFKMYPTLSEDDVIHWNMASARRVFALPTLNYSEKLPPVKTSIQGYYIINSAQIINGTLNVNETVKVAETNLEEILNLS